MRLVIQVLRFGVFFDNEEIDLTYEGIATHIVRKIKQKLTSLEEIDLTYEGIATCFGLLLKIVKKIEEIDLTYEGIATYQIFHLDCNGHEEIDLTYEGIATNNHFC